MPFAIGITSPRMSSSSGTPGRPANSTSTISSKLNSQNGSFRLRGLSTSERSPEQRPSSLCTWRRKIRNDGRILLRGAGADLVRPGRRVHRAQFLVGDELDGVADGRIVGDAALEFGA